MESFNESRVYDFCYHREGLKSGVNCYIAQLKQNFHGHKEKYDGTSENFLASCI